MERRISARAAKPEPRNKPMTKTGLAARRENEQFCIFE
jgi:hypothetical protein